MSVVLRDYQQQAIDDVRRLWRGGQHRATIIWSPTGAGKTTVGAEIIRAATQKGSRVGWLVHRRELVDQASERLKTFEVDHGIIMRGAPREYFKPVQVCSIQTLIRRSHVFKPQLIFVDECHRALGQSYIDYLRLNPEARLVGLTATPWRTDGRGLGHLFDSIVQCSTPAELTEQGYLVPARVFAPSMPDLAGVKKTAGDYNQKQLAERTDKATLIGDIVDHWKRLADGRQTICFATSVAHSQHIAERFRAAGIAAEHIDGETPLDDRAAILRRLGSGETKVVSNVGVWTEGVDIPVVSCCILARPTQSSGLYLQMAGRILRPHPGKEDALILDHAGCTMQHGFVIDDRECGLDGVLKKPKASNSEESPVGVRICKECYAAFPTTVSICPQCNTPYVIAKQIVEEAGELEEIKPVYTIKNLSRDPRVARIQRIAERMQYKPGWVWRQRQLIQAGLEPQIPEAALRAEYYA